MKRIQKSEILETLRDRFNRSTAVVFSDFRGIKFDRLQEINRELKKRGCIFQVAKNTLAYLAVEGTPNESLRQYLKGQTAMAFTFGDPSAMAKVITKYVRKDEQSAEPGIRLKAATVAGELVDTAVIFQLAALPSRKELLAKMVGSIAAPLQNFVNVLHAPLRDFVWILKGIEQKRGVKE
ncbi:MAG: 50S ribosomal protein L10 [Deltaproteobacteria bacterium]|nr:50S ribosomal protein L10 [Deltaproteobacteria bacterium]